MFLYLSVMGRCGMLRSGTTQHHRALMLVINSVHRNSVCFTGILCTRSCDNFLWRPADVGDRRFIEYSLDKDINVTYDEEFLHYTLAIKMKMFFNVCRVLTSDKCGTNPQCFHFYSGNAFLPVTHAACGNCLLMTVTACRLASWRQLRWLLHLRNLWRITHSLTLCGILPLTFAFSPALNVITSLIGCYQFFIRRVDVMLLPPAVQQ